VETLGISLIDKIEKKHPNQGKYENLAKSSSEGFRDLQERIHLVKLSDPLFFETI
jgi:hypothetical protein